MAESKHEKFIRIAENRTNKMIEMLRLLGNCSNKAVYEYTADEVRKIFGTLENELKIAKGRFGASDKDETFKL